MRSPYEGLGKYGTVGLDLLLSIAFGYWAGHWLDGKLGTRWLTLVGFFFGVAAGFKAIFEAAKRMQAETEKADAAEREARRRGRPTERRDDGDAS